MCFTGWEFGKQGKSGQFCMGCPWDLCNRVLEKGLGAISFNGGTDQQQQGWRRLVDDLSAGAVV
jgi:hypothetical protein